MRRIFVLFLGLTFLVGLSAFPATQEDQVFVIQDGSNACQYLVVERFFACVELWRYWYEQDKKFAGPLVRMAEDMGIGRETRAWDLLLDAARQAERILNRRAPSTRGELEALGHAGFKAAQREVVRIKAESLARLYSRLLRRLEREGIPPGQIEVYLETRIRPTVKLVSTQPLEHPDNQALLDAMLVFEETVR